MRQFEGTVLAGPSFEPVRGRVVVADGRIEAVEATGTASTDIVLPAFVNAHTHIGDSVAEETPVGLGLEEAVAPTRQRQAPPAPGRRPDRHRRRDPPDDAVHAADRDGGLPRLP